MTLRALFSRPADFDPYMGQILQDGKKVLEMGSTYLHSKSRPAQTVGLGNLSFWYLDYLWFASI